MTLASFPVLSVITWSPFVGALLIMFLARRSALLVRGLAVAATTLPLVLSIAIYVAYDREAAGFQFFEDVPLVPALGINYQLGVDGLSLLMVLLTSIIIFAGAFASWTVKVRSQEFYALLLILVTGVYGVFVSLDLFVLFLFYEIAVLPMYLLFGSAFILVGILALYVAGDSSSFSFLEMELTQFDPKLQSWVFLAFYVGFGILAGIWPLHTWSPDGHASAPTAVSMLHAGVLMKLGAYGVVRLGMGLLPDGTLQWSWLVGTIACINIVYGALSAMAQTDLKYVIAYSSVSHMGVVMLGAATLTEVGLNGSVYQMFAHGVMTGLFFALVGLVYDKAHSREIFKMGGFARSMPGIATAFTIAGLSSLGLPGTAGFVAEFLTFLGAWQSSHSWWLFPAVIGAYLTAIYVLRVTKQIFWGPPSPDPHFQHLPDARGPEWAALWILVAVIVLFGIWPALALAPVDTATMPLLNRLWVLQ
jgi:NADH-quinone oxidoreductase subunit M